MTLTAGEQQHLLFTPEEGKSIQEGIRVQGDVKFQNLSSSDKILGGAAISIDPGTVAAEHHIAFFGDGKEGDDRLSFVNNVHQYNKRGDRDKTACGGAIGTCSVVGASTDRPIELTFADLAEVLFSGNQHGGEGDNTNSQLKGGSIAAHYINFVNVGKVTIEGGDLEALHAKQNAYYSGAFTADGVLVENVDDFSVVNNVTKSAYRGSTIYLNGGVTYTDPTSVAREFRITNCENGGQCDVSGASEC